jgi:hypothetical protein
MTAYESIKIFVTLHKKNIVMVHLIFKGVKDFVYLNGL